MRILIFGDSIARGSFDIECGGWANRLSADFSQKSIDTDEYCNLYNLGIAGESCTSLVDRVTDEARSRVKIGAGEVVSLVLSGTNDSKFLLEENKNLTAVSEFESAYGAVVQQLKEVSDHVFCLGLTRVDEEKTNPIPPNNRIAFRNEELERYEAMIQTIAAESEVNFIQIADTFGVTELAPDGIHPNARGHELIYERVKAELEKAGIL